MTLREFRFFFFKWKKTRSLSRSETKIKKNKEFIGCQKTWLESSYTQLPSTLKHFLFYLDCCVWCAIERKKRNESLKHFLTSIPSNNNTSLCVLWDDGRVKMKACRDITLYLYYNVKCCRRANGPQNIGEGMLLNFFFFFNLFIIRLSTFWLGS